MKELRTQIGGKFSKQNPGIFELKHRLVHAGIIVNYPTGDSIIKTVSGVDLSFDPDLSPLSFYEVECEYLKSVRNSSFHTVHNVFQNNNGYVGRSAGMEIGYAILHHVPIVLLHKPSFQRSIDVVVSEILNSKVRFFNILRLDCLPDNDLIEKLNSISELRVDYDLSVEDEIVIMTFVHAVLNEYRIQCI